MPVLEIFQRFIAFFLLLAALGFATKIILIPLAWIFWKIARYPFETRFNNDFWVW